MESLDSLVLCVAIIEQAFDTFLLPPPNPILWRSQGQLQGWVQGVAAWYWAAKSCRRKGLTNLNKRHKSHRIPQDWCLAEKLTINKTPRTHAHWGCEYAGKDPE